MDLVTTMSIFPSMQSSIIRLNSERFFVSVPEMLDYLERGAGSRGTALYTDPEGALPQEGMPELFRLVLDEGRHGDVIQEVRLGDGRCEARWRPVRPIIPQMDYFFENQWREYRQREAEGLS